MQRVFAANANKSKPRLFLYSIGGNGPRGKLSEEARTAICETGGDGKFVFVLFFYIIYTVFVDLFFFY